jgi:hypothetical protein
VSSAEAGLAEELGQAPARPRAHGGMGDVPLDTHPRLTQVVLAVAQQVAQAELVLDGDDEGAVDASEAAQVVEYLGRPGARVLEDADADDDVEALVVGERLDRPAHHLNVVESLAARRGGARPGERALEGDDLGPCLAEVAGQGAHPRADVEHPLAGAEAQGAEEVGPQT